LRQRHSAPKLRPGTAIFYSPVSAASGFAGFGRQRSVRRFVREGVEKDWPHIFTDLEFEPMIEARFAAIKQGFDHIRGRNPKR
jgi:hypothetical protein